MADSGDDVELWEFLWEFDRRKKYCCDEGGKGNMTFFKFNVLVYSSY